jgi:LSD1 subclass zinc finger protein
MGGYGSGRWRTGRYTVEDSLTLTVSTLADALEAGPGNWGTVWWTRRGERTDRIAYRTVNAGGGVGVRLTYSTTFRDGEKVCSDYVVTTTQTTPFYGGHRWWWLCPRCGSRRRKLHLPPGRTRFLCRDCHALTYASCLESHRYSTLFKHLAVGTGVDARTIERLFKRRYG